MGYIHSFSVLWSGSQLPSRADLVKGLDSLHDRHPQVRGLHLLGCVSVCEGGGGGTPAGWDTDYILDAKAHTMAR